MLQVCGVGDDDEWREDKRAEECVEEEHRRDSIVLKGFFLERVVKSQQRC